MIQQTWGTGSNALNGWIFVRRILVEFYVYRLILSSAWQTAIVCLCASLWLLISCRFCKLGFFIFIPFNLLIEGQFPSLQTLDTLNWYQFYLVIQFNCYFGHMYKTFLKIVNKNPWVNIFVTLSEIKFLQDFLSDLYILRFNWVYIRRWLVEPLNLLVLSQEGDRSSHRKQPPSIKVGVPKNLVQFTGKYLCRSIFFW